MEVPQNDTPDPVQSVFDLVIGLLSTYGWTILFFVVVFNLLWSHLYPKFQKWQEKREELAQEAEYKRDPSYVIARDEAMSKARQKMQEENDKLTEEFMAKMKEKEEKKRQEKIEAMEKLLHGKPKEPSTNSSQSLRQEYNPLMGSGGGGSSGFRPSRREVGGGG